MPVLRAPFALFLGAFPSDALLRGMALDRPSGATEHRLGQEIRGRRMTGLTTHILDQAGGKPAAGVTVRVSRRQGAEVSLLAEIRTDADGRARLVAGETLEVGAYRLEFSIGEHFKASGLPVADPPFLDVVVIDFAVSNVQQHWHVPLLVSPYGYSTYRGS